jgi:hypothetical protein
VRVFPVVRDQYWEGTQPTQVGRRTVCLYGVHGLAGSMAHDGLARVVSEMAHVIHRHQFRSCAAVMVEATISPLLLGAFEPIYSSTEKDAVD